MTVNEGEAFIAGADKDTARRLLEAAEKAGLDPSVVRASEGGFIVPADLDKPAKDTSAPAKKTDADKSTGKK